MDQQNAIISIFLQVLLTNVIAINLPFVNRCEHCIAQYFVLHLYDIALATIILKAT